MSPIDKWKQAVLDAANEKLKQIILDAVNDMLEFYCPSEYGLEIAGDCKLKSCRRCWAAAIAEAEQEATGNESD